MENNHIITRFEAYLLTEKRVSHNTFAAYKRDLQQLLHYLTQQNISLQAVNTEILKEYIHYLSRKNISARSVGRKISTLKAFYVYMSKKFGWENSAQQLIFPKSDKKLPYYLTSLEIDTLLKTAHLDQSAAGIRNSTILYLLYATGMRISELTSLKISDIHFDSQTLIIQGKGGKQRLIPLSGQMLDCIKQYVTTAYHIITHTQPLNSSNDYLFPVRYGNKIKSISRQAFWIILKKICIKAGIKKSISPHQLRHSLATHLLKNGADLRSIQILLGHEQLATVEIYTHIETTQLRSIYDKKHPRS